MGEFSLWHWIVVAIVFMALFGYRKLPDAARSIGRSLRVFRAELKGMQEDDARAAKPGPVLHGQVLEPGRSESEQSRGAAGGATAGPSTTAGRPTGTDPGGARGD